MHLFGSFNYYFKVSLVVTRSVDFVKTKRQIILSEDKNSANFEEQIKKLEHLVAQLETGNLSLEDSIKAYEEGVKIAQNCQMTLKNAEQKVEILTKQGEELVKQDFNSEDI